MTGFPRPITTAAELQQVMRADYPLSPQQFEAATAPRGPAVVVAGAGSGKTTLMAARVVWLVATGQVQPDQVLGLTFTNKAAGELASRVREALRAAGLVPTPGDRRDGDHDDVEILEPTVATYNAYAAGLLTEHGLRIGHEPDTRVIADASRYQLAARTVAHYGGEIRLLSDSPSHVIGWMLALDAQLSEHLCSPERLRDFDAALRLDVLGAIESEKAKADLRSMLTGIDKRAEVLGLVEAYRALKHDLGVMEFSDQIQLSARLVTEHPAVGLAEREKFKVVLLDEYQDTSVAQAVLLKGLFGDGHPVMAVGDPNQAIYGWRGASVSNILRFAEDFPARGSAADPAPDPTAVRSYPLTVNRRSDRRILEVANRLAVPLYASTPNAVRLDPAPQAGEGDVEVAVYETYGDELAALPGRVRQAHDEVASNWGQIAVLARDNAHAAAVFHALTVAGIPVEIVGLKGLLELPEVAEVVATLTLLHDLTANAALLTLLSGPRWAIGPRDLALLGRRSRELAGDFPVVAEPTPTGNLGLAEQLLAATVGADPSDVSCLADALDDPGTAEYSPEARERFALLATELRALRRHAADPLLDLVRRIIDVTGIDLELASSVSEAAEARRDNLDLFVRAVAEFQAVDGTVTLAALLAWLEAEDEFGNGLDVATPTEADSIKLLTVHRAKGLEYDAVFLVGVAREKFPSSRGRSRWLTGQAVLPNPLRGDARDLPVLRELTRQGIADFTEDSKRHDLTEELRLAYVAVTRPRKLLEISSFLWQPGRKGACGPSPYQVTVREVQSEWGKAPLVWLDRTDDAENPVLLQRREVAWPVEDVSEEVRRRREGAEAVRRAAAGSESVPGLTASEADLVATWDDELDRLVTELLAQRSDTVAVPLPSALSATALAQLAEAPATLAEHLARPMPRPPAPAARFGTRFHALVEQHFQAGVDDPLLDPDDLPGRADQGIAGDDDLAGIWQQFLASPFANATPLAVEPSFALVLGGQVVRGRIDAVFADPDSDASAGGVLLIDWKTNRFHNADPLQLAIYRVAWSELHGIPLDQIRAAFYYVRDDTLVEPVALLDRTGLETLLA